MQPRRIANGGNALSPVGLLVEIGLMVAGGGVGELRSAEVW
jgi:hypothetical protein